MKILIIGIVASGKTTFARKLSNYLGIKYYEIDSIVHDDLNKVKRSSEEQKKLIEEINRGDSWIIEGTLRKNLFYLCDMADRIIYLDIPLKVRKRRIIGRFIKQKLGIEKSNYKPTWNMLKMMFKWTREFEDTRNEFENKLRKYKKKLVVIKNIKEL